MMPKVRIRGFRPKDFEKVMAIAQEAFTQEMGLWQFDIAQARKLLRFWSFVRLLQRWGRPRFRFYVAEVEGEVVGTTMVGRRRAYAYIGAVMVHPQYRRRGYARVPLSQSINEAFSWGLKKVVLHMREDNPPAKNLYLSPRFEPLESKVLFLWEGKNLPRETPLTPGYTLKRVGLDGPKIEEFLQRARNPKSAEVYGPPQERSFLLRALSRLVSPATWSITYDGEWIGLYRLGVARSGPARTLIALLPSHRGQGPEEAGLTKAIRRAHRIGRERVVVRAEHAALMKACRAL